MKPLIYFDFKEANGDNVVIQKDRLKEILDEVYQTGYNDGYQKATTSPVFPVDTNKIWKQTGKITTTNVLLKQQDQSLNDCLHTT